MNNSPTPSSSSNTPQTISAAKSSTSGIQPQNTPSTRLTLDEAAEKILDKAKSPLGEGEVRKVIETLERMLEPRCPMNLPTRRRCFRGLVKICGEYGILPDSYMIPKSKIQKMGESPVSSGGFSDVWTGAYRDGEGDESKYVAIKVLRYCQSDDVRPIKKNFCREVITWKRLSHSNILGLIGVIMDEKEYSMVSPWMENGNIVEFLRGNPQANPLKLLEDAVRGLKYLHSVDLAHGDLKGANILVSDEGHACLADVGLTRIAGDLSSATATSLTSTDNGASTRRWCPPELLDPESFGSKRGNPTTKSDMYSMAMTIYEVLVDVPPFYEYKDLVAVHHIIQGARPKKPNFAKTRGYTEELWEITTSCWDEVPTKRPAVDYVLDALGIAAEQWKSEHGALSILSPLDEAVGRVLISAKAPLGEDDAREVVEGLEKMLEPQCPISEGTWRRCFQALVKICGEYGILPNSHIILESKIRKLGDFPLSFGGFPDIWSGAYKEDKDKENKYVAIKVIKYCELDDVQRVKRSFCREVITWKRRSHPNLLGLIGVMMNNEECAVVMPWMENGNIVEFLEKDLQANPLKLLGDAARGLQYLHSMDLAHGDLRGANILVSEEGHACLVDVGLTRITGNLGSVTSTSHTAANTRRWRPPELLDLERFGSKRDNPTKKSDIYSMAMTIYEVLVDVPPFHEHKDLVAMYHIIQGERPKKPIFAITRGFTEKLWDMTTSCWDGDPERRPIIDYVLEALRSAAEQWESEQGSPPPPSPLDETVGRILIWAKSPLGKIAVRTVVEALAKSLEPQYPISLSTRRRCLRGLAKICGEYDILPSSYIVPDSKVQKDGNLPVSFGGFSDVWKGFYGEERKAVAIKVIRQYETVDIRGIKKNFCREAVTWKQLAHQNILQFIGAIANGKEYAMISPWMESGTIVEYLRNNWQANPLELLEDATRGLQYLHNMGLAHGDLKGMNILITEEGHACLADVGLTRVAGDVNSITATSTTTFANTRRWCPPELLDPERYGSKRGDPTKRSDIYSMAMTVYEVLTDRVPFYEYNDFAAVLQIIQGARPKKPNFVITRGYTQELWNMTASCWDEDPLKRPTVDYVLGTLRVAAEKWRPRR